MTSNDIYGTATVEVSVSVRLSQPWGPKCTLEQVFDQAGKTALEEIEKALGGRKLRILSRSCVSVTLRDREKREGGE